MNYIVYLVETSNNNDDFVDADKTLFAVSLEIQPLVIQNHKTFLGMFEQTSLYLTPSKRPLKC